MKALKTSQKLKGWSRMPIIVGILMVQSIQSHVHAQDELGKLRQPSSWDDYVQIVQASFGEWEASGVTSDVWDGIPAGKDYTISSSNMLSKDGKKLIMMHEMKTRDGRILSTGSGFITWDDSRGRLYSSMSGFDGGKLYSGPRELIGMNEKGTVWEYVETINGATYKTREIRQFGTGNTWSNTNLREVDGKTVKVTDVLKPATPPRHPGPLIPALSAMEWQLGTWETEFPNGKWTVSFTARNHGSMIEINGKSADGERTTGMRFYDEEKNAIKTFFVNSRGESWENMGHLSEGKTVFRGSGVNAKGEVTSSVGIDVRVDDDTYHFTNIRIGAEGQARTNPVRVHKRIK
ncbi:MAG: hypothetical protein P8L18_04065 [Verrucomicrobiota bacterium]|nr:hypothetical protein [Verrucomicrobiota bacterium]